MKHGSRMQATAITADRHDLASPGHGDAGFWRTHIFSVDHKVVGVQYAVTALCFLFFGFLLMGVMRWQLAYPGKAIPLLGPVLHRILGEDMVG